jgi:hypothetical protein
MALLQTLERVIENTISHLGNLVVKIMGTQNSRDHMATFNHQKEDWPNSHPGSKDGKAASLA